MISILLVSAAFFGSILAGLFGGGAGLIFTPTIFLFLSTLNPNANGLMQTSITTMIVALMIAGIFGMVKHHRYGNVDWQAVKNTMVFVIIGSILGCVVLFLISSQSLGILFALTTLMLAGRNVKQLLGSEGENIDQGGSLFIRLGGVVLGFISTVSGAASFCVPYYEHLGLTIKKAIGTTTVVVWLYSMVVMVVMLGAGLRVENLPDGNIGFLNLRYLYLLVLPTIPGMMLGAKLANFLPERTLKILFTALMIIIAIVMMVKSC